MTIAALTYHAHEGCPPTTVFIEQVRARTSNVELGDGHEKATVVVRVEIERANDRSVGKLSIESPDRSRTERELSSPTCSEVVRALALSTALNLDPTLTEASEPAAPSSPLPDTEPKPTPEPTRVETPSPTDKRPERAPDPERPSATSLGANIGADFLGAPVALGFTIFLDHVLAGRAQPSWRAGLHGSRAAVSSPRGSIDLYWVTTRISGSPLRLHVGDVDLVPNVIAEVGVLAGHGSPNSGFLAGQNAATGWLAFGLGGRLELRLSARWLAELEGIAVVPVFGRQAGFEGQPPIFGTSPLGASAGAGARYVFP